MSVLGQEPRKDSRWGSVPRKDSPFDFRVLGSWKKQIEFSLDSNLQTEIGKRYDSILAKHPALEKDFEFRFQLKQYYMTANFDNVFVLTLKNDNWKAQYFKTEVRPTKDYKNIEVSFLEHFNI